MFALPIESWQVDLLGTLLLGGGCFSDKGELYLVGKWGQENLLSVIFLPYLPARIVRAAHHRLFARINQRKP